MNRGNGESENFNYTFYIINYALSFVLHSRSSLVTPAYRQALLVTHHLSLVTNQQLTIKK